MDGSEELRNFKTSIRDASFVDITFTLTFNAENFRQAYVAADVERKSKFYEGWHIPYVTYVIVK